MSPSDQELGKEKSAGLVKQLRQLQIDVARRLRLAEISDSELSGVPLSAMATEPVVWAAYRPISLDREAILIASVDPAEYEGSASPQTRRLRVTPDFVAHLHTDEHGQYLTFSVRPELLTLPSLPA